MRGGGALRFIVACVLAAPPALSASTLFVREKAGRIWQDGLFAGDGRTGVVAYAPAGLEWTINRNDVFDSRVWPCEYMKHGEVMGRVATSRWHSVSFLGGVERPTMSKHPDSGDKLTLSLSAAILRVRFWQGVGWSMPAIPPVRQEVDTRTGTLRESLSSPTMNPEAETVVERGRDVMAVRLCDKTKPDRVAIVELVRPEDVRMDAHPFAWREEDGAIAFTQRLPGGETYAVAIALSRPAKPEFAGRTATLRTACDQSMFLAVRTTNDSEDPAALAISAVKEAARAGFAALQADNRKWWGDFWARGARAFFRDHEEIDTLWNYSLYSLASQFGGVPMPALNGLFYGTAGSCAGVGSHCYVHDQNAQIPLMPFFSLGHAGFVAPFVNTYERALPEIERRTKEMFGAEGAYLPLNMNQNGVEHPIAEYRYTLCGAAYTGLMLAHAWWYTHDEKILRRVYPLLKRLIRFYTSTMSRDSDGTCHFIWSVPPEIFTGSVDDTATVACLKPCLETAVEAAGRFRCDEEERALWMDVLAHYPKMAKHPDGGWWCGPEVPFDHYMYGGHLFYPFFPAECDTDMDAALKTLEYYRKFAVEVSHDTQPPHPVHEWSALYSGIARIRLLGGTEGWGAIVDFKKWFAKPNGMFSHNSIVVTELSPEQVRANRASAKPLLRRDCNGKLVQFGRGGPDDLVYSAECKALVAPVLESGAAFLMMASEALCQSWNGEISIFPSVPDGFSGRFENFRVHGGYSVTAEMRDGKVVDCAVSGATDANAMKVRCRADKGFMYRAH